MLAFGRRAEMGCVQGSKLQRHRTSWVGTDTQASEGSPKADMMVICPGSSALGGGLADGLGGGLGGCSLGGGLGGRGWDGGSLGGCISAADALHGLLACGTEDTDSARSCWA